MFWRTKTSVSSISYTFWLLKFENFQSQSSLSCYFVHVEIWKWHWLDKLHFWILCNFISLFTNSSNKLIAPSKVVIITRLNVFSSLHFSWSICHAFLQIFTHINIFQELFSVKLGIFKHYLSYMKFKNCDKQKSRWRGSPCLIHSTHFEKCAS